MKTKARAQQLTVNTKGGRSQQLTNQMDFHE
jgi:hypothetical protein